jgi:hypothetical protein
MSQFNTPAAPEIDNAQLETDLSHLKILSILWYVIGGLNVLGGCCSVFYLVLGIAALTGGIDEPDAEEMGIVFTIMGSCMMLLFLVGGGLMIYAGRGLATQTNRTLIFVMAVILLLNVPLGTALGIFTIIVLNRDSVKLLFEASKAERDAGAPDFG